MKEMQIYHYFYHGWRSQKDTPKWLCVVPLKRVSDSILFVIHFQSPRVVSVSKYQYYHVLVSGCLR